MSVVHNLIAVYRNLSKRQKAFLVGACGMAGLLLINWLSGGR